jgi:hypothetical protein
MRKFPNANLSPLRFYAERQVMYLQGVRDGKQPSYSAWDETNHGRELDLWRAIALNKAQAKVA